MSILFTDMVDQVARQWRGDRALQAQEQQAIRQQINTHNRTAWRRRFWPEVMTTLQVVPNTDGDIDLGQLTDIIMWAGTEDFGHHAPSIGRARRSFGNDRNAFRTLRVERITPRIAHVDAFDVPSLAYTDNAATDELTFTEDHGFSTQNEVRLGIDGDGTASLATGLTLKTSFFVIRVSATVLQLATTAVDAAAGTQIDITAAGSGVRFMAGIDNNLFVRVRRKAPVFPQPASATADPIMEDYNGTRISPEQTADEIFDFSVEYTKSQVHADMLVSDKQNILARQKRVDAESMLIEEDFSLDVQAAERTLFMPVRVQRRKM